MKSRAPLAKNNRDSDHNDSLTIADNSRDAVVSGTSLQPIFKTNEKTDPDIYVKQLFNNDLGLKDDDPLVLENSNIGKRTKEVYIDEGNSQSIFDLTKLSHSHIRHNSEITC